MNRLQLIEDAWLHSIKTAVPKLGVTVFTSISLLCAVATK